MNVQEVADIILAAVLCMAVYYLLRVFCKSDRGD